MKTCIILYAIAALCVVQMVDGSDINNALKSRVRGLRTTALSTARKLISFKRRVRSDLETKLSETKAYYTKDATDVITLHLEDVRNAANAAKAEGRNPDSCLKNTETFYDGLLRTADEDLNKCVQNSMSILDRALEQVEATIQVARDDVNAMDVILQACKSSNESEERNCLSGSLTTANARVNNLRSTAVNVERAAKAASGEALDKANLCLPAYVDPVRNTSVYHKFDALDCIKKAV